MFGRLRTRRTARTDARRGRARSAQERPWGGASRRRGTAPALRRRSGRSDRWCSTIIRYGWRAVLSPWTCVTSPAGSYRTRHPRSPEPPAEVDVLDVHEVARRPSRRRVASASRRSQIAAPDTQSTSRARRIGIELPVAAGERVVGHTRPEEPVTDRVADRRHAPCRRVHATRRRCGRPGPTAPTVGLRVEARQDSCGRARVHPQVGVAHRDDGGMSCARTPRLAPPA